MRIGKGLLASLAGGLLLMGAAQNASANSITVTIGTPSITSIGGGLYEWAYGATLSAGSEIIAGDSFEIVDFGPVFGVTPFSGDWTPSLRANTTVPGADVQLSAIGAADTDATNVLFTYGGSSVGSATLPTDLGIFKIISDMSEMKAGAIIGRDHQYAVGVGPAQINYGPTAVPIPLPAAAWGGVALLGLLGAARVRKSMK